VTRKPYDELSPTAHRRLVVASLLRAGASVTVLVVVYYVVPLDRPLDPGTWIGLGLGLGLVGFAADGERGERRGRGPPLREAVRRRLPSSAPSPPRRTDMTESSRSTAEPYQLDASGSVAGAVRKRDAGRRSPLPSA
jgi:hypothetical protein